MGNTRNSYGGKRDKIGAQHRALEGGAGQAELLFHGTELPLQGRQLGEVGRPLDWRGREARPT